MPRSRGLPVLLRRVPCPQEPTLFPQGREPSCCGVSWGPHPYVEVPPDEHRPRASRAFGRRIHGHVSPQGRLRRPGVTATARAVDVDDRKRPTRGHLIEVHGLARHDVQHVSNLLRSEHVRSQGNQETATYRRRRRG